MNILSFDSDTKVEVWSGSLAKGVPAPRLTPEFPSRYLKHALVYTHQLALSWREMGNVHLHWSLYWQKTWALLTMTKAWMNLFKILVVAPMIWWVYRGVPPGDTTGKPFLASQFWNIIKGQTYVAWELTTAASITLWYPKCTGSKRRSPSKKSRFTAENTVSPMSEKAPYIWKAQSALRFWKWLGFE